MPANTERTHLDLRPLPWAISLSELRFTFARSGGPGGQNVNKVNSKASLHWKLPSGSNVPADVQQRLVVRAARRINAAGELVITSQRFREQLRNIDDCLEKLRELVLSVAVLPKPRKATRPTKASRRRRLDDKRAQSRRKKLRGGGLDDS